VRERFVKVDILRPHPPAPSPIGDGEKESGRKREE